MLDQPQPPFAEQHQQAPGLESQLLLATRAIAADRYKAAGKLDGKVALITGGDSGIGRAVAVLFAREGADVAIGYLAEEQADAEETRRGDRSDGRALPADCPATSPTPAFCDELVERTVAEFGKLDILVSNAAHQNRKERLEDVTDEEFERTFKTNIYAYFRLARAALRHLKPGAAIIATSSETGIMGSKAAARLFGDARVRSTRSPRRSRRSWSSRASASTRSHPGRCGRRSIRRTAGSTPTRSRSSARDTPMKPASATRGARTGVRVPRVGRGFVVHHRASCCR